MFLYLDRPIAVSPRGTISVSLHNPRKDMAVSVVHFRHPAAERLLAHLVTLRPPEAAARMAPNKRPVPDAAALGSRKKQTVAAQGSGSSGGRWEELSPELLGDICQRLPADEVLRAVPFVCRSWRDIAAGPYCWGVVDLQPWCRRVNRTDVIDTAVRKLVRKSAGSLRRLSAYKMGNSAFMIVAECVKCLTVLQIPMSNVTDEVVLKYAKKLSKLKFLDISYCLQITNKGIEALGTHCKSLIQLNRSMPPAEADIGPPDRAVSNIDESEALAVANSMPELQHLELSYGRLSDVSLRAIFDSCKNLRVLDIRGCWNVKMEDADLENKCYELFDFRDPWYNEFDELIF